jgi:hypothetical protein
LWVRIPLRYKMYLIQHYVIKFVSDLRQICGFLRFPPPSKTVRHDITEILLKVALSTINQIIISTFVVLTCILFLSYKRCSECANWSHVDKVIYWLDYLNRFCEIHTFYRMYIVHMFIVSTGKFAANMIVIYCCSFLVRP